MVSRSVEEKLCNVNPRKSVFSTVPLFFSCKNMRTFSNIDNSVSLSGSLLIFFKMSEKKLHLTRFFKVIRTFLQPTRFIVEFRQIFYRSSYEKWTIGRIVHFNTIWPNSNLICSNANKARCWFFFHIDLHDFATENIHLFCFFFFTRH